MCARLVSSQGLPEARVPNTRWSCQCGHRRGDPGHPLHKRQGVLHHHEHVLQCPVAGEQVTQQAHLAQCLIFTFLSEFGQTTRWSLSSGIQCPWSSSMISGSPMCSSTTSRVSRISLCSKGLQVRIKN